MNKTTVLYCSNSNTWDNMGVQVYYSLLQVRNLSNNLTTNHVRGDPYLSITRLLYTGSDYNIQVLQ